VSRSNDRRLHGMDARDHAYKRMGKRAYGRTRTGPYAEIEDANKASRARAHRTGPTIPEGLKDHAAIDCTCARTPNGMRVGFLLPCETHLPNPSPCDLGECDCLAPFDFDAADAAEDAAEARRTAQQKEEDALLAFVADP
jgi:hypothetical protein